METHSINLGKNKKLKVAILSLPENDFRFPIIGTLIITKYIQENCSDIIVKLIDNTFDNLHLELEKFKPDIIGFSTFTQSYLDAISFAKKIKQKNPQIKIIVGGPHITTLPDSLDPIFDFGVMGEGEQTIIELIKSIKDKKRFEEIKGLIYYKNNKLVMNKRKEDSSDINNLFPLNYNLLNKKYFKKKFIPEIYNFGTTVGMMTSIGCPFDCRFCSIKACWKIIRFRDLDSVVKEIKNLYFNYKVRHIDLFDDLFSINKERLKTLREKLGKEKLLGKITFSCQARANTIDEEMCQILKSLNVKTLVFGFESGSDRILKYIKKDDQLSIKSNQKAVLLCKKYRLNVYGCLMFGIPGEKIDDLKKTIEFIDFCKKNKVARLWVQILIPLPATEIWEIAKKRGKIKDNIYELIPDVYQKDKPLMLDSDVPLDEFVKYYNLAKKKCRFFVYKTFIKTISNNPLTVFYFLKESLFYLKRFFNFMKQ